MKEAPSYYAIIPAEIRYADITPNAKLLYGEITALSNKEGFCFATNTYLAELYKVEVRQIRRWIKELTSHNFISIRLFENNKRQIYLTGGTKMTGGWDKNDSPLLIYNNTSNNNIYIEQEQKQQVEKSELPFASDKFKTAWNSFVCFRAELKHSLTKTSTNAIFNKLRNFPESEAIAMLQASIENGWRGVFPLVKKAKKVNAINVSNFENQESGFSDGNY